MRRGALACIFCDASELTEEHVFPRWLATILTTDMVGTDVTSERTRRSAEATNTKTWPAADVAYYAIRVVCAPCNNRWMSAIEGAAKPALEPMIRGEKTTLSPSTQLDLAAWAALKAYVVEYALGDLVVATQEERRALMDNRHPSGAVPVRIGAVQRHGIPNSVTRLVYNVGADGTLRGHAACTTFALGCAVVQVCHGLGITIDWTRSSVPRMDHLPLNPPCPRGAEWPPAAVLDSASLAAWERPIQASDPADIVKAHS